MHPMSEIRFRKPCLQNQQVWHHGVKPGISRGLKRLMAVLIVSELAIGVTAWQLWHHFIK